MLRDTKVQDYMTTSVISVSPTTPIRIGQQLMEDHHIRHLPVVRLGPQTLIRFDVDQLRHDANAIA